MDNFEMIPIQRGPQGVPCSKFSDMIKSGGTPGRAEAEWAAYWGHLIHR